MHASDCGVLIVVNMHVLQTHQPGKGSVEEAVKEEPARTPAPVARQLEQELDEAAEPTLPSYLLIKSKAV